MTAQQVGLLAALLLFVLTVLWLLEWAVPLVARLHFLREIELRRDAAVDLALDGDLPPDHPAVREFVAVTEALEANSRHISLAKMVAYETAYERMGVPASRPTSLAGLTPDQRARMVALQQQVVRVIRAYLVWGSPAGYVGLGMVRTFQFTVRARHVIVTRGTRELAQDAYAATRAEVGPRTGARPHLAPSAG